MRLIIAGSRTSRPTNDYVNDCVVKSEVTLPVEVVCGTARGVDRAGCRWGQRLGYTVHMFPAAWRTYGQKAGIIRNQDMGPVRRRAPRHLGRGEPGNEAHD